MKRFDQDIKNYTLQELLVMKARHEAGKTKFPYVGPFTLEEVNAEIANRIRQLKQHPFSTN